MVSKELLLEETSPTPEEIKNAFATHGVDIKYYKNWNSVGREWDVTGGGLYAVVIHHTATASAKDGSGAPSLWWAVNAYDRPVCNQLVGKDKGTNWCLSAGSAYHSGDGGPWSDVGVGVGNVLHYRAWGIEIDDPGVGKTINSYQIEQTARSIAALWDLCRWPEDGRTIITHGDWTDSGPYLNEKSYGPHRYRKNDTLRQWYDQNFWRNEARKYRIPETYWDETIPTRRAALRSATENINNKASFRIAARMYDLKLRENVPKSPGQQRYPINAIKSFQKSIGLNEDMANGLPNKETWIALFGKDKP